MKKFMFLAASSLVLAATPALANDHDGGWYLRGNAGYGVHHDMDFDDGLFRGDVESEGNVAASLGLGYEFGDDSNFNNWRLELDADSLWTDLGKIDQTFNSYAKLRTNTLMLNALYDFADNGDRFQPYIGAGIGLVQGQLSAQAHDAPGVNGVGIIDNPACLGAFNGVCTAKGTDTTWGYQGIAGIGYEIAENLFWDTHYTYMKADSGGLDFDNSHFTPLTAQGRPGAFFHETELNDVGAHTLVTGLRYKFGGSTPPPPPPPPAPTPSYTCWNGDVVFNASECAARPAPEPTPAPVTYYECWDGSSVTDLASCPARPEPTYVTCADGTQVTDMAFCAPTVVETYSYNNCGPSNVAIFNVPVDRTPKQMSRLGTMPEFGDSHGLTPTQFYEKLQSRYNSSATDKAYLNYLFKSMGYSGGFSDANSTMFSEEVLPVGTRGMLGLGEAHHYEYSVLPSNDRDRQAFRIQSANGSVIHFMKTCGNYMYACN